MEADALAAGESRAATLTFFASLAGYAESAIAATVVVSALVNPVATVDGAAPYESGTADSGENVFVFSSPLYAEGEYAGRRFHCWAIRRT